MKSLYLLASLLVTTICCFGGEKEKAFEESFLKALSTSDEATLELVEFSRSTPKLFRDVIAQSLKEDRIKKIKNLSFVDPPKEAVFEFDYEGITYIPTLEVIKEMKITYDMSDDTSDVDGTTYRLGLRDGHYKIVASRPK